MTLEARQSRSAPLPAGELAIAAATEPMPRPARLLRLPEVMARVGLKRSAIYQRMAEGRFPKSRSIGAKCAVWVEAEIESWIQSIAAMNI